MNMVSDETWQQLDPLAGALSRRQRRRVYAVLGGLLLVGVLGYGVLLSGLLVPRVAFSEGGGFSSDGKAHTFTVALQLNNDGRAIEHVTIGRSGRGLQLTGVDGLTDGALPPGASVGVVLRYRVTDCAGSGARVQPGDWPVPVTVRRPWGATTVHLAVPELLRTSMAGADDQAVAPVAAWQQQMARMACTPGPGETS